MYCRHCGSFVQDEDLICKNCGALTEYGEKVSRHEALPPQPKASAVNPDGSLNMDVYREERKSHPDNDAFFGPAPSGIPGNPGNPGIPGNPGNPGGGYYYAPPSGPRPQEEAPRSNGMAVAGLVCSFLFWPLGIVFSAIGLARSKDTRSGKGMSVAGLIISVIMMFFTFFM